MNVNEVVGFERMTSDGAPRILGKEKLCDGCLAKWVVDWNIDFRYVGMAWWYRLK